MAYGRTKRRKAAPKRKAKAPARRVSNRRSGSSRATRAPARRSSAKPARRVRDRVTRIELVQAPQIAPLSWMAQALMANKPEAVPMKRARF